MGLYKIKNKIYNAKNVKDALIQHKTFKDSLILVKCKDSFQNPKSFFITPFLKEVFNDAYGDLKWYKSFNLENEIKSIYTNRFLKGDFGAKHYKSEYRQYLEATDNRLGEQILNENKAGFDKESKGEKSDVEITGIYNVFEGDNVSRIIITYDPEDDETIVASEWEYNNFVGEHLRSHSNTYRNYVENQEKDADYDGDYSDLDFNKDTGTIANSDDMNRGTKRQRQLLTKYGNRWSDPDAVRLQYLNFNQGDTGDIREFLNINALNDPALVKAIKEKDFDSFDKIMMGLYNKYLASGDDNKFYFRTTTPATKFMKHAVEILNKSFNTDLKHKVNKSLYSGREGDMVEDSLDPDMEPNFEAYDKNNPPSYEKKVSLKEIENIYESAFNDTGFTITGVERYKPNYPGKCGYKYFINNPDCCKATVCLLIDHAEYNMDNKLGVKGIIFSDVGTYFATSNLIDVRLVYDIKNHGYEGIFIELPTEKIIPYIKEAASEVNKQLKYIVHTYGRAVPDLTKYLVKGEIDDGYSKKSFKEIKDSIKGFGKLKSIKQGIEGKSLTTYTFIGTLRDCEKLLNYTEDENKLTADILLSKNKSKMYDAVKYIKDDEQKSSEIEKLKKKLKDYSSIKEDGDKIRVDYKSAKELNAAMDAAKLWGHEYDSSYDDAGKAWVIFEKKDLENLK